MLLQIVSGINPTDSWRSSFAGISLTWSLTPCSRTAHYLPRSIVPVRAGRQQNTQFYWHWKRDRKQMCNVFIIYSILIYSTAWQKRDSHAWRERDNSVTAWHNHEVLCEHYMEETRNKTMRLWHRQCFCWFCHALQHADFASKMTGFRSRKHAVFCCHKLS